MHTDSEKRGLIIGLGKLSLGLIVPIFQECGYSLLGTSKGVEDNSILTYTLKTPTYSKEFSLATVSMASISDSFDFVITSVGRNNLSDVASWYKGKGLSAPVFLAENLPLQRKYFSNQIPIVVDRLCSRIEISDRVKTVYTEDYQKIVTFDSELTQNLRRSDAVDLLFSKEEVEEKRKEKLFTVNITHSVCAFYGQKMGYVYVHDAIQDILIQKIIIDALNDSCMSLGFVIDKQEMFSKILERLSVPIYDPLSRVYNKNKKKNSMQYIRIPLSRLDPALQKNSYLSEIYSDMTHDTSKAIERQYSLQLT